VPPVQLEAMVLEAAIQVVLIALMLVFETLDKGIEHSCKSLLGVINEIYEFGH
jgi:hypothetical protein